MPEYFPFYRHQNNFAVICLLTTEGLKRRSKTPLKAIHSRKHNGKDLTNENAIVKRELNMPYQNLLQLHVTGNHVTGNHVTLHEISRLIVEVRRHITNLYAV